MVDLDLTSSSAIPLKLPNKFKEIFDPYRYKIFYGGRGSGKSWSVATALIVLAMNRELRILCAREIQNSLNDSVMKLLLDTINRLDLGEYFTCTKNEIICTLTGSHFFFTGLYRNISKIKSYEAIDICWIEEGANVSKESLNDLFPTIRKEGSEIWITFNPHNVDDPVYDTFIAHTRPDSLVVKVNADDNPWFPETLRKERAYDKEFNPDRYAWIWEGECLANSEAQIFHSSFLVKSFETPEDADFLVGADWGFATDPTAMIRGFIHDNYLYLDREVYGYGVTYEGLPALLDYMLPDKRWPVTADSARPDTIDYLNRKGYNIKGSKKGKGSIIDGIERLKGFKHIFIHPSLIHTIEEFRMYQYKINKHTGDILPVPEDKNNHIIDALRYATEGINPKASFIAWSDL